ncbi:MAG: diaminopimelate epimerase [Bacteroidetes bacterium]|nr:diaminopimelate epimerase [Bacteroidota bacterium]
MKNLKCKVFSASGNIISLVDNRTTNKEIAFFIENIKDYCSIKTKKTDGLVIINNSDKYDFSMSFVNSDGTTGMMCGNGGRCAIYYYANMLDTYQKDNLIVFNLDDTDNIYYGSLHEDLVSIYFDIPYKINKKTITINGIEYRGSFFEYPTPHFVIEVENVFNLDFKKTVKKIRNHPAFAPLGTNVDFFHKFSYNNLYLRTFERGVEKETGACGTGAIVTAVSFFLKYGIILKELTIVPTSKSELYIKLSEIDGESKILLTGSVEEIITLAKLPTKKH